MLNVTIGLWGNLISWNLWTIILNSLSMNIQDPVTWLPPSLRIFRQVAHDACTWLSVLALLHWRVHQPEFIWIRKKSEQITYSLLLLYPGIYNTGEMSGSGIAEYLYAWACVHCVHGCADVFFFYLWSFFLLQLCSRGKEDD